MQRATKNTKQTAAEVYAARYVECADLLKRVTAQLEQHRTRQAADARDWGFAGDLGRVAEELAYVLASLGDRSAVDQKGVEYRACRSTMSRSARPTSSRSAAR